MSTVSTLRATTMEVHLAGGSASEGMKEKDDGNTQGGVEPFDTEWKKEVTGSNDKYFTKSNMSQIAIIGTGFLADA